MNKDTQQQIFTAMVYLIPAELAEGVHTCIPAYVGEALGECHVFFVENERTARRYLKRLRKDFVVDDHAWVPLSKGDEEASAGVFEKALRAGQTVGIISEAGCPGVADPGQALVARAQAMGVKVRPLVGPSSLLLALMASGLNGQSFRFSGYLPIEAAARAKAIRQLEDEVVRNGTTQIFIETPYRNRQMLQALLEHCRNDTRLCLAVHITSPHDEYIRTLRIGEWKTAALPDIHKKPAIFLLGTG